MKIHLVTANRAPVRLVHDGRELRILHGPFEMFVTTTSSIRLDDVESVSVVAPYDPPSRPVIWFLVGATIALLSLSLGIDMDLLRMAASLPLALAIVLAIVPIAGSSTRVLLRLRTGDRSYMIAVPRENLSALRGHFPDAEWHDEDLEMGELPLTGKERLRLKLMQISAVMSMISLSAIAMTWLEKQTEVMSDGTTVNVLFWSMQAAEVAALVLFGACWFAIVRTTMRARKADL